MISCELNCPRNRQHLSCVIQRIGDARFGRKCPLAGSIDADVFDDLVRDDVGRHLLFEGLGVKHDDAYGLHLINLLVTMRKATVREEVREAVRALSSTQLDLARSQYIERAKKRVREDLLQQE